MTTRFSRANLLTQVLSTHHQEAILYFYEGALTHLNQALEAIDEGRHRACQKEIRRASSLIVELACCLDFNRHGALAARLDNIYNYLIEVLTLASKDPDAPAIETCRSVLMILGDAWRQALEVDRRGSASESTANVSFGL